MRTLIEGASDSKFYLPGQRRSPSETTFSSSPSKLVLAWAMDDGGVAEGVGAHHCLSAQASAALRPHSKRSRVSFSDEGSKARRTKSGIA